VSVVFRAGVEKSFPKAKIVYDRFQVMKMISEALDTVRNGKVKTAREYRTLKIIKTVIYLLSGKLDFGSWNPFLPT